MRYPRIMLLWCECACVCTTDWPPRCVTVKTFCPTVFFFYIYSQFGLGFVGRRKWLIRFVTRSGCLVEMILEVS
ncbi:hypothetical protein HOY80DRAFT_973962 [Tuber brumale]|nr:hypothetical protein HOY80DRAFT_973962 [Tuber brumale]